MQEVLGLIGTKELVGSIEAADAELLICKYQIRHKCGK